jgi:hypothetical protein
VSLNKNYIDELAERKRPFEETAWNAIGWDDGKFRIKGGKTLYEAVMYNGLRNGRLVKLARLKPQGVGFRQINRYVEPETILEFL